MDILSVLAIVIFSIVFVRDYIKDEEHSRNKRKRYSHKKVNF